MRATLAIFCARPIASSQFFAFSVAKRNIPKMKFAYRLTENMQQGFATMDATHCSFTDLCQKYNNNYIQMNKYACAGN